MANQKTVSVENDVARAITTLTDKMPTLPLNGPQGRRAIGPRVTFHFISDPWSSANTYEGYDVVQAEGVSYVAIQPVPSGIQLDNTQYWFKWSEPNAQFANLMNQVSNYNERIKNVETIADTVKDISVNITANGASVSQMQDTIDNAPVGAAIFIDQDITIGPQEHLVFNNRNVYGNGNTVTLTPYNPTGVPTGDASGYEGFQSVNSTFDGIVFASNNIYQSYQNYNASDDIDKASNRYAIRCDGGVTLINNCSCVKCGMVFDHSGSNIVIENCTGTDSEMFFLSTTDGIYVIDSCDIQEDSDASPQYYHHFYIRNCSKFSLINSNLTFDKNATNTRFDIVHPYNTGEQLSQNANIHIDNCYFDCSMCTLPMQVNYGDVVFENSVVDQCDRVLYEGTTYNGELLLKGNRYNMSGERAGVILYSARTNNHAIGCHFYNMPNSTLVNEMFIFDNCVFEGYFSGPTYGNIEFNNCKIALTKDNFSFPDPMQQTIFNGCNFTGDTIPTMITTDPTTGRFCFIGCTFTGFTSTGLFPNSATRITNLFNCCRTLTGLLFYTVPQNPT